MDSPLPGDATLARLLAEAASPLDPAGLRDLLAGVLAAPDPPDRDAWMALVAPEVPPELAERLRALKDQTAAATPDALAGAGAPAHLQALRAELESRGLQGFIVPRSDEFQGEYVPRRAERLAWLTGFTGSAGTAVVLPDRAALFVDGRYTLQAGAEVDATAFQVLNSAEIKPHDWLADSLRESVQAAATGRPATAPPPPASPAVGYDPWLHTPAGVERLEQAVTRGGGRLLAVEANPVDAVWTDQPPPPLAPVVPYDAARAGQDSAAKRSRIAELLAKEGQDAVLIAAPDSLAWLLNLRGGDVPFTPLALGFALQHRDGSTDLFIDERKLPGSTRQALEPAVRVAPLTGLQAALDRLGQERRIVRLDPNGAPAWAAERLRRGGPRLSRRPTPAPCPRPARRRPSWPASGPPIGATAWR